ncbi:histidine phosphatase family protein [Crossiella sp. NPDC003009]
MRTVYVVAHPEATHHVQDLVGGWHDSELTEKGRAAAAAIAESLRAQIPEDAEVELYTSDLKRTAQTAQAIGARFGLEPVQDKRLREKSYGEAEGRPDPWLRERFVPPPAEGERMFHDENIPGAETKGDMAVRIYEVMDEILARPAEHQIIVTHGGALTFVVANWIKFPLESAGYANFNGPSGSITVLRQDDYFHNRQVRVLGDTAHLAG